MKITCPNNASHKEFEVRMPVEEVWTVDSEGEVDDQREGDGAIYKEVHECPIFCATCNTEAVVTEVVTPFQDPQHTDPDAPAVTYCGCGHCKCKRGAEARIRNQVLAAMSSNDQE